MSTSLLDFHQTKLLENVSKERPELFIAVKLNEDESSPWYKRLDLGGKATVGLNRKASPRTMQKGIMKFLKAVGQSEDLPVEELYLFVRNFWKAVLKYNLNIGKTQRLIFTKRNRRLCVNENCCRYLF